MVGLLCRHVMPRRYFQATSVEDTDQDSSTGAASPSSNGKSDPLDFRPASEDDPMLRGAPRTYQEHDL
ncbi:hypothetical protein EB796_012015 [Bugula neritina]|uniref:Uncharacterized protein n=1 Tax=Bugula neritina TaxID=10212 RepID=A0A7J7JVD4_BUGNE|nr:hypothetical protein EB796_012015 [Bugula neritina]